MSRQKILAFLIAILPVAYIYAFPILINNLGHAILLFLIFPMLLMDYKSRGNNREQNMAYILFSLYLIIISVMAPIINSFSSNTKELLSAAEFSVIVYFLINDKRIGQIFIRIYTKLAIVFAMFLLLQYIFFVFFHTPISGAIPFLNEYNREVKSILEGRVIRIASVFAEPSHFSVYEVPALLMLLFGKSNIRRPVIWIAVITISILLSTSSNGIIVIGIVYFSFIVYKYFRKINIAYIFIGGALLIGAFVFISRSDFIEDVTYGLFVQEADMTTSKAELRIYRGFNLYSDLPLDKKVFGIGWRDAENYCKKCNPDLFGKYSIDVFDYFNSIAGTLIYSGLIGLIFLLMFFLSLWKRASSFSAKTLILCVLILMGTSSVLMSDQWILFLTTIISLINIGEYEENNNYSISEYNRHGK